MITLCREHPFTVPLRTLISVLARVLSVPTDSGFPLLPRTGYPWMITEGYSVLYSLLHRCLWGDTGISLRPRRTLDFSCACCKLVHFTAGLCHDFHVTNVFLFFFFLIDGGRFSVPHCSSWVQRSAAQLCASPVLIVSGLLFLFSPPERCEQQQHVQYSN